MNGPRSKLGAHGPMVPSPGMGPGSMGPGAGHGIGQGPQRPTPRSGLGAQKPGMRASAPPPPKIEINGPDKSLAPKKRM